MTKRVIKILTGTTATLAVMDDLMEPDVFELTERDKSDVAATMAGLPKRTIYANNADPRDQPAKLSRQARRQAERLKTKGRT